jgi:hypothetical protein
VLDVVVHICHPSYAGGHIEVLDYCKKVQDLIAKITNVKRAGGDWLKW